MIEENKKANSNMCSEYCFLIHVLGKMKMWITRQKTKGKICVRATYKLMLIFLLLCTCFHVSLYKSHCLMHWGEEMIAC